VEELCRAGQATDENIALAHYMVGTLGYKFTQRIYHIYLFLLQQWLHERVSMLRYMYIILCDYIRVIKC
jgi:hypothetical protein